MKAPDEKMLEYTLRPATLQTADGRSVPGYRAEVEPHVAGVYTGKAVTTIGNQPVEGETRFVVTKPVTEMTGKPINRELLQRIAETSKGKHYALENWSKWRNDLHYVEQHVSRVQILDLWNHPAMLIVLLGLLAAEWTTRKFWSLP
jgi:hypothetical protein